MIANEAIKIKEVTIPNRDDHIVVRNKSILMINWDSYPNITSGGVYSWEKALIDNLPNYRFTIINVLSNPGANSIVNVPKQVEKVICIPLFGSLRLEEYLNLDDLGERQRSVEYKNNSAASSLKRRNLVNFIFRLTKTDDKTIKSQFIPLFLSFLESIIPSEAKEFAPQGFLSATVSLHEFFRYHDVKKCVEHAEVCKSFLRFLERDPVYKYIDVNEALTIYRIIQRNLQLLAVPISRFDIIHSSLAWFPSLLALIVKAKYGTPFLLTEHGVAFKELVLYYNSVLHTEASSIFWKNFSVNMIRAFYTFADIITPVCYANAKWEKYLGADNSKINVIYNGVDTSRFKPNINTNYQQKEEIEGKKEMRIPSIIRNRDANEHNDGVKTFNVRRPTVVFVGRIDPFKDIVNLLLSIHYLRKTIPNILCKIYGNAYNVEYAERCISTLNRYGLQHNVMFMGSTESPEAAYSEADIVVMTSVTEGFPFSIIEAMACGKAIVATNVGGVAEALDGSGFLVTGRHPYTFANALLKILRDAKLRAEFATSSQIIVRNKFNLQSMINQYEQQYEILRARLHSRPSANHYGDSIT